MTRLVSVTTSLQALAGMTSREGKVKCRGGPELQCSKVKQAAGGREPEPQLLQEKQGRTMHLHALAGYSHPVWVSPKLENVSCAIIE